MVRRIIEPSGRSMGRCTNPLPKVRRPTMVPLSQSWMAPLTISLAEAEYSSTNTTSLPFKKLPFPVIGLIVPPSIFDAKPMYSAQFSSSSSNSSLGRIRSPFSSNLLKILFYLRSPPLDVPSYAFGARSKILPQNPLAQAAMCVATALAKRGTKMESNKRKITNKK